MGSPSTFQRTFFALLLRRNIVAEEAMWVADIVGQFARTRVHEAIWPRLLRPAPIPDPGFPAVASVSPPTAPSGPPTPDILRPLDHTPGPEKSSIDPRSASTCG